jgi:predicted membrane protein
VLSLAVAASASPHPGRFQGGGDVALTPATVADIGSEYHQNLGDFTLDLRNVDFSKTTEPTQVTITQNLGDLKILLPADVDTTVHAKLNAGDARVFGARWGGFGTPARDVTDKGSDGTGGGTLLINVTLNAGDLEVRR